MIDLLLFSICGLVVVLTLWWLSDDYLGPIALFALLNVPLFFVRPLLLILETAEPRYSHLYWTHVAELARHAVVLYLVSFIAFAIGFAGYDPLKQWLTRKLPAHGSISFSGRRLRLATYTGVAASILSIGSLAMSSGDIAAFMISARTGGFGGMYVLLKMPLVTSFLAVLLLLHEYERGRFPWSGLLALLVSAALIMLTGDRSGVIAPVLTLIVAYHFSIRRVPGLVFTGMALAGFVAMAIMAAVRLSIFAGIPLGDAFALSFQDLGGGGALVFLSRGLNLDMVDYFLVVLQDFRDDTLHYGRDFVLGLVGIVPRGLWPGKPEVVNVGNWFGARYLGNASHGAPITATGEWWLNFGVIGVIVGSYFSGAVFRSLWEYVRQNDYTTWAVVLYMVVFLNMTSFGIFGTSVFIQLVYWSVPLYVVYRWAAVPSSSVPAAPAEAGSAA